MFRGLVNLWAHIREADSDSEIYEWPGILTSKALNMQQTLQGLVGLKSAKSELRGFFLRL